MSMRKRRFLGDTKIGMGGASPASTQYRNAPRQRCMGKGFAHVGLADAKRAEIRLQPPPAQQSLYAAWPDEAIGRKVTRRGPLGRGERAPPAAHGRAARGT